MEIMTAKEAASLDSMILLDCPFCGKTPVLIKKEDSYGKHYDVACGTDNCYLREGADYWLPAQDVIDLWNTRATTHTREDEMKKFNKSDIQVSGNRVLVKQYHDGIGHTWRCIAEFYSYIGLSADPAVQAQNFAQTITRED